MYIEEDVCSNDDVYNRGCVYNDDPAETFPHLQVPPPDLAGRKEIFKHFLNKVKSAEDVDVQVNARGTTGFTGNYDDKIHQNTVKPIMIMTIMFIRTQ